MSPLDASVLVLAGIGKRYRRRSVLSGLDLALARGEIVGLLGPNGSGKTTTLRIAAGYLWPDDGEVRLAGQAFDPDQAALRARIGYLPERVPLYDPFTVGEYLGFVAAARGLRGQARDGAVARVLEAFELGDVRARVIGRLSKGFRQRVGLAQALVGEPDVLLLDEPTNGLDPFQIQEARRMIRTAASGRGVIFSTHILQEVAALCTRVVYLHEGRLVGLPLGGGGTQVEVVLARAESDPIRTRVHALDAGVTVQAHASLGHGRLRFVFDLDQARVSRAELVRLLAGLADVESVTEVTVDLESALDAALGAKDAGA
ncbi:MAG: ABC transporter ATP-binding protein [Gammaproteobacteria bacterium]